MKKLLLALLVLVPGIASAQVTPWPTSTTPPIFGNPSEVDGGGSFAPQLFGPQSCTVPAYAFTGATTSGFGLASATACVVVGGTQRLGVSATAATSTVPIVPSADGTLDLGSASFQWRTAYLGTSAILADAGLVQFGTTTPPTLLREAADHLIQRRTTNAQRWSVANTWASTISNELFSVDWQTTANFARVGTRTAATGTARTLRLEAQGTNAADSYATIQLRASDLGAPFIRVGLLTSALANVSSTAQGNFFQLGEFTSSATAGTNASVAILPTYNQASGTAANTDFLINRTQTAVGSGAQLLADFQVSTVSKFSVTNTGNVAMVGGLGVNLAAPAAGTVNAATALQVNGVNVTLGVAGNYKIARGSTAFDGSNPTTVATGLTTVVSCTATLIRSTALTTGSAFVTHNTASGANVDFYAWVVAGTASTGTENFEWICVGT